MKRDLITINDAAKMIGVTRKTICKWIRIGKLGEAVEIDRKRYIEKKYVLKIKKQNDDVSGMISSAEAVLISGVSRSTIMKAASEGKITKRKNAIGGIAFDKKEIISFFEKKRRRKREKLKRDVDDFGTSCEWMGELDAEKITKRAFENLASAVIRNAVEECRERFELGMDMDDIETWIKSDDFEFYNFAHVSPDAVIETCRKQYGGKS